MHSAQVTDLETVWLIAWAVPSMCCLTVRLVQHSVITNLKGFHAWDMYDGWHGVMPDSYCALVLVR